jgi:hypothetical protein
LGFIVSLGLLRHAIQACKGFFIGMLYESLSALYFSRNIDKKVYMHGAQHWFVLLEKLGESFFDLVNSHIGGTLRVKDMSSLTITKFNIYLWEN